MLKINRYTPPLLVIITSLTVLLSHIAIASPTSTTTKIIPAINYLLLDEHHESDSLIPGKLYSAAELNLWRKRTETGPHVVRGDAYGTAATGSRPDYGYTQGSAQQFDAINDTDIILYGISRATLKSQGLSEAELAEITFFGEYECVALDPDNSHTFIAWNEFGPIDRARDAAFVDLLNDTSIHTDRIKRVLLEQAQQPCMDFNNRDIFRNGIVNNNAFWLYLEWLHKVLKTYDYLDESAFTAAEKSIIDNWFKGAAEWGHYYASIYQMESLYLTRASNPLNSKIDFSHWQNNIAHAHQVYKDSSVFWAVGSRINNRQLGQVNFVVHAGVKYDNDTWKKEGAQIIKEFVSFHYDDNGYFAELTRSTIAGPHLGITYGANTLVNVAEIAHILYLDGYENLFEYKSKARINPSDGAIELGTVEKSLEWTLLKFRENFMLENSPDIYPNGLSDNQEGADTVIHFCKSTINYTAVGRIYNPAAIINRYYKNPLIKEVYNASDDYGNLCGYPDINLDARSGPHGISPGILFQYSDANDSY